MNYNNLQVLPVDMFHDTISLEVLSLKGNRITNLPSNIFQHLKKLIILDLSNNRITHIQSKLFWMNSQLVRLFIKNNQLTNISPHSFHPDTCAHLEEVDFSGNNINMTYESIYSPPLTTCFHSKWTKINLADNRFTTVSVNCANYLRGSRIFLERNHISVFHMSRWEDCERSEYEEVPATYSLAENPIECDCRNYDFFRYLHESRNRSTKYNKIKLQVDDLYCHGPPSQRGKAVSEVSLNEVLTSTDCLIDCPELAPCRCLYRPHDRELQVNCQDLNLTEAPRALPVYTYANHTTLFISNNSIKSLPKVTQPGYERVTEIYASHNKIKHLNISSIPTILQVIELDSNLLTTLQPATVDYIMKLPRLHSMAIHNNTWNCQCRDWHFIDFVQGKFVKNQIQFAEDMKCSDGKSMLIITENDVCKPITAPILTILVGVIMGLICVLFIVTLLFGHQKEIQVWLFANQICLWWITEEELDQDKEYDAFICFSHKDEEFVENELIPNLTSGLKPFKLCVHTRDWIPGEYISNQIVDSVKKSRRTIIVLSPNFVESEWGKMEFRVAHAQAISDSRARVIVILYSDVGPLEKLDPELQAYLKINTYVKWGDPGFWDKLRYALPHLPQGIRNFEEIGLQKGIIEDVEKDASEGYSSSFSSVYSFSPSLKEILGDVLDNMRASDSDDDIFLED